MVSSSNTHTQGYKEWALRNHWSEDLRCDCDEPATFSISKTVDNPWRKFRGCPNYQETMRKFHMDLEEANNKKTFAMEVLKLSEEAKNNKEVQLDILNMLKVELLMMVMLLVVVIVMGFMVHHVMVKAL
ncbi:unnamed protein product [Lactuca saligna]|uniref:Zinc finger GRF-type domain-containing protein n=1 Tax=Lactuca saligna TaxID=75948 RepID=A0AA35Z5Z8_LACSI|nr:unnamed protein product [Lactuca saligna]